MTTLLVKFGQYWGSVLVALTLTCFVWIVAIAAHRLYFGPLARFPGDKLAALTGYYETYFDCLKAGRYWVEIQRMHEQYGPIVRISPWEVHVNDPDFNEPYKISSQPNKYHWYYSFVGSSDAAFGTADHDLHRMRRGAQSGYFTAANVASFDPKLEVIVSKLISRLQKFKNSGQPVNLSDVYRCLATDSITEFAFHKSYNLLDLPDFAATFNRTIRNFTVIGAWNRHFGFILDTMQALPLWVVEKLDPDGYNVLRFFHNIENRTSLIVDQWNAQKSEYADFKSKTVDCKSSKNLDVNIIHQMLSSQDLPPYDKSPFRLALEMRTLVAAGTETTGNMLQATTFHLLKSPERVLRLKDEIRAAQSAASSPLRYTDLQRLPYLSAVVAEGLRCSTSVSGRLPRINPRHLMQYKDWIIPAGTVVSTTQKLIHENPVIFSNPKEFIPERWLNPTERKHLEKYLQPFGRGSRNCLGLHLANSEIYVALARIFDAFDMELFETTKNDIEQFHDFFSPFPASMTGVRVLLS